MKKVFILGTLIALNTTPMLQAQVVTDSAGNVISETSDPAAAPVASPATPVPPPTTATRTTTTVYDVNVEPGTSVHVSRLRFGAYVAPTISWMKPTASTDDENKFNVENNGSKVGFTYGLMMDYFFAPNYGIVSGIQINQTGGKIMATSIDQSITKDKVLKSEFDYRLQYLEIPLALKLRTDDFSGFRFFGQLGVSAGFNIGKKADYTVRSIDENLRTYDTSGTKIKLTGSIGNIAPVMFQMNIGAGLEYPLSNKLSFYLGLFFNNGFAPDATKPNLFDEDKLGYAGEFRDANTRLNNFALRFGLFF